MTSGSLSAGFEFPEANFALISFGRLMAAKAKKKKDKNSKEISSLSELSPGDYVVHSAHGIGVFEGIHKLAMNGIVKDYLKVRYAKNDTLYVPVTQLDLVSKYIGPGSYTHLDVYKRQDPHVDGVAQETETAVPSRSENSGNQRGVYRSAHDIVCIDQKHILQIMHG